MPETLENKEFASSPVTNGEVRQAQLSVSSPPTPFLKGGELAKCPLVDRLREVHRRLNQNYPAGSWHWAKENRPDLTWPLESASGQIDEAVLAGDEGGFEKALAAYVAAWRTVFREYRNKE